MALPLSPQSYPALTVPMAAPAADSANNVTVSDVAGSKLDTTAGNSLYALLKRLDLEAHNPLKVHPTLAAGVAVLSGNVNWTLGAFVEVVPAATIATNFRIRHISIETCDKTGQFELAIYCGAADTLIATVRYSLVGAATINGIRLLLSSQIVPGGSRIRVKLASHDGAANQCTQRMSIAYTLEA